MLNTAEVNHLKVDKWDRGRAPRRVASSIDALICLRSRVTLPSGEMHTYDTIEKTPIAGWMNRFFAEPPSTAPFFAGPNGLWDSGPVVGFERQLVNSGKPIIVVQPRQTGWTTPYPSERRRTGADGSAADLSCGGWRRRLGDIVNARTGRLGLCGFSGGGNEAIKVWRADRNSFDELYLFDPQSYRNDQGAKGEVLLIDSAGSLVGELRNWYRDERHRLRLIGGLQHGDALSIATLLEPGWRAALAAPKREKVRHRAHG